VIRVSDGWVARDAIRCMLATLLALGHRTWPLPRHNSDGLLRSRDDLRRRALRASTFLVTTQVRLDRQLPELQSSSFLGLSRRSSERRRRPETKPVSRGTAGQAEEQLESLVDFRQLDLGHATEDAPDAALVDGAQVIDQCV
jgi:hypothetical protein